MRRTIWLKLGVLVCSFAFALMLCEIILRVLHFSYASYFIVDPYLGWRHRAGVAGLYRIEGSAHVRINSKGLRDREHVTAKPLNTLRIAVLGDSIAEAFQVAVEKTFWSILEKRLATCSASFGKSVEVINFGVAKYSTAEELHQWRQEAWQYAPDIVLLAFTTFNDISDNSRLIEPDNPAPHYFIQDGQLQLDDSFRYKRGFRLRSSLAFRLASGLSDYLLTTQLLNQAINTVNLIRRQKAEHRDDPLGGIHEEIYSEPKDPAWRDAWEVTEKLLLALRDEVVAKGARFTLVIIPPPTQVDPRPNVRQELMQRPGIQDLGYVEKRLMALAGEHRIEAVSLASPMQRFAEAHGAYLYGFPNMRMGVGHWNEEGHRIAGEIIAQHFCAENAPFSKAIRQ